MSRPATEPSKIPETSIPVPPAVRLVEAFKEAVEFSRHSPSPAGEAFAVECLLIAADASFVALDRFADLWHEDTYGDPPSGAAGEERAILEGYEAWLDAADLLRDRLSRLMEAGYQSGGAESFDEHCRRARAALGESRDRREIERKALRTDQLARLAARLTPMQESYDGEGMMP